MVPSFGAEVLAAGVNNPKHGCVHGCCRTWRWPWLLLWCSLFTLLISLSVYLYVELHRLQHESMLISSRLEIGNKDKTELRLSSSDLTARNIEYEEGLQDWKLKVKDWKEKAKNKEHALNESHSALYSCELKAKRIARDSSKYSKESKVSSVFAANRQKPERQNKTQKEKPSGDKARRLNFLGPETCVDAPGCDRNDVFDYCGAWKVTIGNCEVDFTKDDCLSSPNFPSVYLANDACSVDIHKERTRPFYADVWSPGSGATLTIDSKEFSRNEPLTTAGPIGTANFIPEESLIWSSDNSVVSFGWKICASKKSEAGPLSIAKDLSCTADPAGGCDNLNPGGCVLTAGDTCAESRTGGYHSFDQCWILIAGQQTLNFDYYGGEGKCGGSSCCDGLRTAVGYTPKAIAYEGSDWVGSPGDASMKLWLDPAGGWSCVASMPLAPAGQHGKMHWITDSSTAGSGFKFCVQAENTAYKKTEQCERTCGGCIHDYKDQLLQKCVDDVWFEEVQGCSHFASPGVGFTSNALSTGGEKCTKNSAATVLSAWNTAKSTAIAEVDILFVRRLRLHCPLSCGICTKCIQGRYRDEKVAVPNDPGACKDCPIGQYQDGIHKTECTACPAGQYQDGSGSTACKACQVGRYSDGASGDGNACGIQGIAQCTLCPAGKVQALTGNTTCVDCGPGKSQSNVGQSECLACTAGKYESGVAAANCTLCQPGKVGVDIGAISCSDCFPGMHQDISGETACKKCEAGRYNPEIGKGECIKCEAGKYQDQLAARLGCIACGVGNYSNVSGSSDCEICPRGLSTFYPGQGAVTGCVCAAGTYGLQGSGEDTCTECPAGFFCPGGHSYSDSAIDTTPMLSAAYMSLPGEPYKAFTCQGTRMICQGRRQPLYNSESPHNWLQVCAGGRIGQACADCPEKMYKDFQGCKECNGFDEMLFWFAMPCFFVVMVALHIFWSRPSSKERSDMKIAVVGFNLYLLYCQILGVFQTVLIDWASPFKEFLELTSYMRLRTDFLKPSCGVAFDPTRDYITRGLMPLMGMASLCSVYVICQGVIQVFPRAADVLPPPVCRWMYFVNTIGSVYMLFSSGLSLTAFLPHQCQSNPGGLSNIEWPVVLCSWDDPNYVNMTVCSVFAVLVYVAFFPTLCAWQVISHPVASATDPYFFVKYKFLFQNYTAEARYWGLIMVLRNVCLAIALAFLQQDTFFQVTCMTFIMTLYLVFTCLCWPWSISQINYLDIVGCIGLSFIMSVGTGFIEAEVNQGSLLVLLSLVFVALIGTFVACILYYLLSFATGRYDFTIFLSHAKFNGGAVARLFKMQLGNRLASGEKIFLDSDNLVSLHELHVFVQHTRNLTLLLTPDCYAREWVAVEIVTSFLHDVHIILISINKGLAPDEAFLDIIPNVFRSCLEGRFPSMGINVEILKCAYEWIAKQPIKLDFDVYSAPGRQNTFFSQLIPELSVGNVSKLKVILDSSSLMQSFKVRPPKGKDGKNDEGHLAPLMETTRIFLCRERAVDVQQEASCICLKITLGALLDGDIYMAPVNAEFTSSVRIIEKFAEQGLILMCLTKTLFKCLDTITEVTTGVLHNLFVIPVQIDNDFAYPGDAFYESFERGEILGLGDTKSNGNIYGALKKVLQTIFTEISIPFNANAGESAIKSSGKGVMDRYSLCMQDTAGVVGMIVGRLKEDEKRALDFWVDRRKDGLEEAPPRRASITASKTMPAFSSGVPALSDARRPVPRKGTKSDPEKGAKSDPESGSLDYDEEDNKAISKAPKKREKRAMPTMRTMLEKSTKGDDVPLFGARKNIDDSDASPARQKSQPTLKSYMERKSRQMQDGSATLGQSLSNDSSKSAERQAILKTRELDATPRESARGEQRESARGEQRTPRLVKRNQAKDRARTEEASGDDRSELPQAIRKPRAFPTDRARTEEASGDDRSKLPQALRKLSPKDRIKNEEGFGDGSLMLGKTSTENSSNRVSPYRPRSRRTRSNQTATARRPVSGSEDGYTSPSGTVASAGPASPNSRRMKSKEATARRPFSGSEETAPLTGQRSAQAAAATGSSDQPYKPNPKALNSLPTVEPVIQPPAPGKSRLARW